MPVIAVGIPWYRREEFEALRASFVDGDELHDTYEQWLADAESLERQIANTGTPTTRVIIDPHRFHRWCKKHRLAPNARARSRYASEHAHQAFKS